MRLGDLGSTAAVFVGALLGFGVAYFALLNVVIGAVWVVVAIKLRTTILKRGTSTVPALESLKASGRAPKVPAPQP